MEFEQIIELIKTVSESDVTSVVYKTETQQIQIRKKDGEKQPDVKVVSQPQMPQMVMPQMSMPQMMMTAAQMPMPQMQVSQVPVTGVTETAESEAVAQETAGDLKTVKSPLVGTFYAAASPDDEPFVKVGDVVKKGQKIGIIEAMKLMNDIESDFDGEVVEILVSNENMVEYGQPLFKIK